MKNSVQITTAITPDVCGGAAGNFDLSLNTDLGEEFIENCIRSAMKL